MTTTLNLKDLKPGMKLRLTDNEYAKGYWGLDGNRIVTVHGTNVGIGQFITEAQPTSSATRRKSGVWYFDQRFLNSWFEPVDETPQPQLLTGKEAVQGIVITGTDDSKITLHHTRTGEKTDEPIYLNLRSGNDDASVYLTVAEAKQLAVGLFDQILFMENKNA